MKKLYLLLFSAIVATSYGMDRKIWTITNKLGPVYFNMRGQQRGYYYKEPFKPEYSMVIDINRIQDWPLKIQVYDRDYVNKIYDFNIDSAEELEQNSIIYPNWGLGEEEEVG